MLVEIIEKGITIEDGDVRRLLVSPRAVYTHEHWMLMDRKGAYLEWTIPIPTYIEERRR